MVANASREVLFVLKPVPSEDAAAQFGRMVSLAEQANAKILQATEKASDEWAKSWAAATERTVGGRVDAEQRALQKQVSEQSKAIQAQQREAEKAAKSQERALAQRVKEEERARKAAERDEERKFKAQVDYLAKIAAEERRKSEAEAKDRQKSADDARRLEDKAARDREKAGRDYERFNDQQRSAAMAMKTSLAEVGEGVVRTGRGFAQLGILGEESAEQLVRAFIKVQAVADILAGGLKIYRSLVTAVDAYRKSVEMATLAENALAVSRARSAAAGAAAAGTGAGGVAGGAAGGAAAGALGAYALPIAGAAALLGGAALSGRALWERSHGTRPEDSYFGPDSTAAWGLGMAGRATALDPTGMAGRTPYGKLVAERAAMQASQAATERMAAARERTATEAEAARAAEQDRQAQLATLAALERDQALRGVSVRPSLAGLMGAGNEQRAALEATRPGWDANEQDRGLYSLAVAKMERELALQQQQTAAEAALKNARGVYGVELGGYQSAQSEATQARESLGKAMSGGGSLVEVERLREAVAATSKAEEDALSRLSAANDQRIRQEETIGEIRRNAAELAVQATQEEMALRDQMIERDRQRLMSAAERIASMTKAEQESLAGLIQKARAGGELSTEEFRKFDSLGLEELKQLREREAQRLAKPFFDVTGAGRTEEQRLAENERIRKQLEINLKDQREFRVNVEMDTEKVIRDIADEVKDILEQNRQTIIDRVRSEIGEEAKAGTRRNAEAAQARAAVIR